MMSATYTPGIGFGAGSPMANSMIGHLGTSPIGQGQCTMPHPAISGLRGQKQQVSQDATARTASVNPSIVTDVAGASNVDGQVTWCYVWDINGFCYQCPPSSLCPVDGSVCTVVTDAFGNSFLCNVQGLGQVAGNNTTYVWDANGICFVVDARNLCGLGSSTCCYVWDASGMPFLVNISALASVNRFPASTGPGKQGQVGVSTNGVTGTAGVSATGKVQQPITQPWASFTGGFTGGQVPSSWTGNVNAIGGLNAFAGSGATQPFGIGGIGFGISKPSSFVNPIFGLDQSCLNGLNPISGIPSFTAPAYGQVPTFGGGFGTTGYGYGTTGINAGTTGINAGTTQPFAGSPIAPWGGQPTAPTFGGGFGPSGYGQAFGGIPTSTIAPTTQAWNTIPTWNASNPVFAGQGQGQTWAGFGQPFGGYGPTFGGYGQPFAGSFTGFQQPTTGISPFATGCCVSNGFNASIPFAAPIGQPISPVASGIPGVSANGPQGVANNVTDAEQTGDQG